MMKLRYFLPFLALSATLRTTAAEPPRLVVQIVVSSMRAEDLNRYAGNFSDEGFLRLVRGGTFYPESHYDYLHTSTPVSLATLTTGANPSVHGIVAERWIDYVNNNVVELIKDRSAMGIDCDAGIGDCSPRNLVAPTLGESLQQSSPKSLVATVALDPASAVVAGGYTRNVFWMDAPRANWITSSFYAETLPVWARKYNLSREILGYIPFAWELKYPRERYRNSQSTVIDLNKPEHLRRKRHRLTSVEPEKPAPNVPSGIERMLYTPSGNAVTLAFAKQLLTQMPAGQGHRTRSAEHLPGCPAPHRRELRPRIDRGGRHVLPARRGAGAVPELPLRADRARRGGRGTHLRPRHQSVVRRPASSNATASTPLSSR